MTIPKQSLFAISLLLSSWIIFFWWRPFFLGFYGDDYVLILRPSLFDSPFEKIEYLLKIYINRPLSGLFASFFLLLAHNNPLLWQLILGLQAWITAQILSLVVVQINLLGKFTDKTLTSFITPLWFALPVTYGFIAWPTHSASNSAMIFYLLSFYSLLKIKEKRQNYYLSLLFFTLSCFTLEAFYLQFIPILFILFFFKKQLNLGLGQLKKIFWHFIGLQAIAIIFNRMISGGNRKTFDLNFLFMRVKMVLENPEYWHRAVIPLILLASLGGIALYSLNSWRVKKKRPHPTTALILICLTACVLSIFIYFIVGYTISPFGTSSRTTMVISLWSIILLLPIISLIKRKYLAKIFLISLYLICGPTSFYQASMWAESWSLQKTVLNRVPTQKLSSLEDRAIIITIVPNYVGDVLVFEPDWVIGPGITYQHPILKEKNFNFIPHKNKGARSANFIFENHRLVQKSLYSGQIFREFKTPHFYIWNFYTGKIYLIRKKFQLNAGIDPAKIDFGAHPEI